MTGSQRDQRGRSMAMRSRRSSRLATPPRRAWAVGSSGNTRRTSARIRGARAAGLDGELGLERQDRAVGSAERAELGGDTPERREARLAVADPDSPLGSALRAGECGERERVASRALRPRRVERAPTRRRCRPQVPAAPRAGSGTRGMRCRAADAARMPARRAPPARGARRIAQLQRRTPTRTRGTPGARAAAARARPAGARRRAADPDRPPNGRASRRERERRHIAEAPSARELPGDDLERGLCGREERRQEDQRRLGADERRVDRELRRHAAQPPRNPERHRREDEPVREPQARCPEQQRRSERPTPEPRASQRQRRDAEHQEQRRERLRAHRRADLRAGNVARPSEQRHERREVAGQPAGKPERAGHAERSEREREQPPAEAAASRGQAGCRRRTRTASSGACANGKSR